MSEKKSDKKGGKDLPVFKGRAAIVRCLSLS